jgi:hypothetical protein
MMDDLVQFLRDRLDEDERVAREAASTQRNGGSWQFSEMQVRAGDGAPVTKHTWVGEGSHIARHDPARVLAEVQAKRLLLDRWSELQDRIDSEDDQEKRGRLALTRHGLDMFVFQLGTVYADHPDYRQEWRP